MSSHLLDSIFVLSADTALPHECRRSIIDDGTIRKCRFSPDDISSILLCFYQY